MKPNISQSPVFTLSNGLPNPVECGRKRIFYINTMDFFCRMNYNKYISP